MHCPKATELQTLVRGKTRARQGLSQQAGRNQSLLSKSLAKRSFHPAWVGRGVVVREIAFTAARSNNVLGSCSLPVKILRFGKRK